MIMSVQSDSQQVAAQQRHSVSLLMMFSLNFDPQRNTDMKIQPAEQKSCRVTAASRKHPTLTETIQKPPSHSSCVHRLVSLCLQASDWLWWSDSRGLYPHLWVMWVWTRPEKHDYIQSEVLSSSFKCEQLLHCLCEPLYLQIKPVRTHPGAAGKLSELIYTPENTFTTQTHLC